MEQKHDLVDIPTYCNHAAPHTYIPALRHSKRLGIDMSRYQWLEPWRRLESSVGLEAKSDNLYLQHTRRVAVSGSTKRQ